MLSPPTQPEEVVVVAKGSKKVYSKGVSMLPAPKPKAKAKAKKKGC